MQIFDWKQLFAYLYLFCNMHIAQVAAFTS